MDIIETERCRITSFKEEMLDDFMLYRNDPVLMKYQFFKGLKREEYAAVLLGKNNIEKGMQLAVTLKSNNNLIGDLFLKAENNNKTLWIGYTIIPSYQRMHYAFEAVSGILKEAKNRGYQNIMAGILPENINSSGLLNKLNFKYLKTEGGERIYILEL